MSLAKINKVQPNYKERSSLRPPTLMIDLLFGALMLFAMLMGDPNAKNVYIEFIELPVKDNQSPQKAFLLIPKFIDSSWIYFNENKKKFTPQEVKQIIGQKNYAVVLAIPEDATLDFYFKAINPLQVINIQNIGIATTQKRKDS